MPAHAPHTFHDRPATRTDVTPLAPHRARREGQGVTRPLTGNAEVRAGSPPLRSVRTNPPVPRPLVSHQVRQLVQKRSLHLRRRDPLEGRVELDVRIRPGRPARRRAHAPVPAGAHPPRQGLQTEGPAKLRRPRGQLEITPPSPATPRDTPPSRLREGKLQLKQPLLHAAIIHNRGVPFKVRAT